MAPLLEDTISQNSKGGGGGYNNYWKTQRAGNLSTFQSHLSSALAQTGFSSSWAAAMTELVGRESSWNPSAKNPTSTAHGYGQFLRSTRAHYESRYGISYTTPVNQLVLMMYYVRDRYGTPQKALEFWDKNKWY